MVRLKILFNVALDAEGNENDENMRSTTLRNVQTR